MISQIFPASGNALPVLGLPTVSTPAGSPVCAVFAEDDAEDVPLAECVNANLAVEVALAGSPNIE